MHDAYTMKKHTSIKYSSCIMHNAYTMKQEVEEIIAHICEIHKLLWHATH
jgi:hypothetical protein